MIAAVFGLCLGAPSTYNGVLVLAAFTGFGVGGNIPIDTTICLEFIPQVCFACVDQRKKLLILSRIAVFCLHYCQCSNPLELSYVPVLPMDLYRNIHVGMAQLVNLYLIVAK